MNSHNGWPKPYTGPRVPLLSQPDSTSESWSELGPQSCSKPSCSGVIEGIQGMLTKIKWRKYRRALQPLESHQASGLSGAARFPVCLSPGLCPDFFVSQLPLLLQAPNAPSFDVVLGICFSRCHHQLTVVFLIVAIWKLSDWSSFLIWCELLLNQKSTLCPWGEAQVCWVVTGWARRMTCLFE